MFGLYVTVIPVIAFWGVEALKPEWQDGRFESYLVLFLLPKASLLFLVLLAYSVACYLFLLAAPNRFSGSFLVRFGIYTGVLLTLQYCIVTLVWAFTSLAYVIVAIWISPFILIFLYRLAIKRWTVYKVNIALLILVLAGILLGTFWRSNGSFLSVMGFVLSSPCWLFLMAFRTAIWLFKNHETKFTLPHGLGFTAWIAVYIAAWRFDILKMYELYAALPTKPPADCYIATAATHGHPQIVLSWTVQNHEKPMKINRQLQILKFAELGLMAVNSRLHAVLRRIYNTVGKYAAGRIRNPFMADAAYILLKPWEWCATLVLGWIIPDVRSLSMRIYMNN